eukprot:SAG11_NODE_4657_length_1819_cov_1.291279_1_plen_118_part_10
MLHNHTLQQVGFAEAVGAVFDGTFVYYCPYSHGRVIRFDSRLPLADTRAWSYYDADRVHGLNTGGFDGGWFDGRYVWFQPFVSKPLREDDGVTSDYGRMSIFRRSALVVLFKQAGHLH